MATDFARIGDIEQSVYYAANIAESKMRIEAFCRLTDLAITNNDNVLLSKLISLRSAAPTVLISGTVEPDALGLAPLLDQELRLGQLVEDLVIK